MNLKRTSIGLMASTMLCSGAAAFAQDTPQPSQPAAAAPTPAPNDEQVIIVTAQKR
jgi:hypothetical protein